MNAVREDFKPSSPESVRRRNLAGFAVGLVMFGCAAVECVEHGSAVIDTVKSSFEAIRSHIPFSRTSDQLKQAAQSPAP